MGTLDYKGPHILEDLLGLEWERAEEDQVALCHDTFIVIFDPNAKFLLKCLKQMRLSGGHIELHIG